MNEKKAKELRRIVAKVAGGFPALGYAQTPRGVIVVAPRTQREVTKKLKKAAGRGR